MSLSLSVLSQSGPPKSVGGRASGGGGGGSYTTTGQYRGGNFFFFFFFFEPGLKLDEKSIENGLEGQKFLVVCLFWGGCHHPNSEIFATFAENLPLLKRLGRKTFGIKNRVILTLMARSALYNEVRYSEVRLYLNDKY